MAGTEKQKKSALTTVHKNDNKTQKKHTVKQKIKI